METVLVFLALLFAIILYWVRRSPSLKGAYGEAKVKLAADLFLNNSDYRRLDDVTLPIGNRTTQIDHVVVSIYGVFVIETKNMEGWIFGAAHQRQWTQVLYKKKFRFQNPLRQNYLHVKAVQSVLRVPKGYIHSVVVFAGGAELRTQMPQNVTHINGLIGYVRSFDRPVFTAAECDSMVERLQAGRFMPTTSTERGHVDSLRRRDVATAMGICPRCGGRLVQRTARKGPSAGSSFLGCSEYPGCKYTSPIG